MLSFCRLQQARICRIVLWNDRFIMSRGHVNNNASQHNVCKFQLLRPPHVKTRPRIRRKACPCAHVEITDRSTVWIEHTSRAGSAAVPSCFPMAIQSEKSAPRSRESGAFLGAVADIRRRG